MFKRGKSYSEIGLVSKQLFAQESHSNAKTVTSYAFGPSVFIRSEIITDHRNDKQLKNFRNSQKGRTFSSSSSKIFVKAHSVSKEETFLKKKGENKQSLNHTKQKLLKYSEEVHRLKHKILLKQTEVDRKLLIKKVLDSKAINSNISIIQEINASHHILAPEKRNALTLLSNPSSWAQQQNNRHQETQPQIHIQTVIKEKKILKTEQNKDLWSQGAVSQQLRPDMISSFVNNENSTKKEVVGMQQLKMYMSQMQMSLKQSIREQIEVAYNNKQKQILINYQNTLKQYDSKLTAIEGEVVKKKDSEQKMMEGLIKVFQSKVQEIIKKNVEQISKINSSVTKAQQKNKQESNFNIQREQSIKKQVPKQVQEVSVVEEIKAVQRKEIKTVERKAVAKQFKNAQIVVKRQEANGSLKSQKKEKEAAKVFKKNIFEEVNSNQQFQIEEIKLSLQSKNAGKSHFKNAVVVKEETDLSFQLPDRLPNQSFDSERPTPKKDAVKINNNQKPIKTDKSASLRNYPQKSDSPPQEQKNREQKPKQAVKQPISQAESWKLQLRKLLMKQTQEDPYLTAAGQVVSYCNKLMKKSKLKWRLPSLLLYRYCYDGYRLHTPLYEQGLKVGLLKPQDVQKFKSESVILRQNMMKVMKAVIKKNELDAAYQKLIQSEDNMVQKLKKLIEREVKNFIDVLWQSDQVGDTNVLQCALRMINGVFIVHKLNGNQSILILDKIEELGERQIKNAFDYWVNKLDQLLADNH